MRMASFHQYKRGSAPGSSSASARTSVDTGADVIPPNADRGSTVRHERGVVMSSGDGTVSIHGHAGERAVAAMKAFGADVMFTLNGGHIWPFYDAARNQGVRVVDTRHEQTATF